MKQVQNDKIFSELLTNNKKTYDKNLQMREKLREC